MQYAPYDKYGRYMHTFAKRFTQPLYRYIVPPPQECSLYLRWFEPQNPPLVQFFADVQVAVGDVLELFALDERVVFQGAQVEVIVPVEGVEITLVMNTPTAFSTIDCSAASSHTYLPKGGVLDSATNLTDDQFIIDNPDYIGIRIDALGGDIRQLQFQVTLLVNEQFDAELPTNASQVNP